MSSPRVVQRAQTMPSSRSTTATASEWRFVLAVIGLVLLITTVPALYAYLSTPAGMRYMGILVNVPDHTQYFSWFREFGTQFLAANKLTPEPNAPIFFNLLWFVLARLAGVLGLPFDVGYQAMYQLMRVVSTVVFLLLVYRICAWFFADVSRRRAAFLITVFTSGFGWVLVLMKYTVARGALLNPLDVFVAEGNTFYSALGFPHFIGAAVYMFTFDLFLRGQAKKQWRYMVAAGLFAQFMGWQHAYDLVIVYGVIGTYIVFLTLRDRRIPWFMVGSAVVLGLLSMWPSLYSFLLTKLDPVWKGVLAQFGNAGVFTPPLYRLPVLLGAPLLLAMVAVAADGVRAVRNRQAPTPAVAPSPEHADPQARNNDLFVKAWFLIAFVLVYLPVDFQIHMLNGWQVPIAILATKALFDVIWPALTRWLERRGTANAASAAKRALTIVMALLILPTNVYLLAQRFIDLRRHEAPLYLHTSEVDALHWLENTAKSDDVILSSLNVGQYVPMFTGAHAYLAHWAQTLDYYGKTDAVNRFFNAATTDADRRQILDAHSVDYVVVGPEEHALGTFNPDQSPLLKLVHSAQDVNVYAVQTR